MAKPTERTIRSRVQYLHHDGTRRVVDSRTIVIEHDGQRFDLLFELRLVQKSRKRRGITRTVLDGPYWYAAKRDPDGRRGRKRVLWVYVGKTLDVGKGVVRLAAKMAELRP